MQSSYAHRFALARSMPMVLPAGVRQPRPDVYVLSQAQAASSPFLAQVLASADGIAAPMIILDTPAAGAASATLPELQALHMLLEQLAVWRNTPPVVVTRDPVIDEFARLIDAFGVPVVRRAPRDVSGTAGAQRAWLDALWDIRVPGDAQPIASPDWTRITGDILAAASDWAIQSASRQPARVAPPPPPAVMTFLTQPDRAAFEQLQHDLRTMESRNAVASMRTRAPKALDPVLPTAEILPFDVPLAILTLNDDDHAPAAYNYLSAGKDRADILVDVLKADEHVDAGALRTLAQSAGDQVSTVTVMEAIRLATHISFHVAKEYINKHRLTLSGEQKATWARRLNEVGDQHSEAVAAKYFALSLAVLRC
jgi:hypothetical protein